MPLRFDIAGCFALAILAKSAHVRADDTVPLRLRYEAPQTCPDADVFLGEVAARTPLARPAGANETATVLHVVIEDVSGGSAGTLELAAPGATTSVRKVSAADCGQVISALALMTALAIDPNASLAPAPPPADEAPRPLPIPKGTAKPAPKVSPARSHWAFEVGAVFEALGGVAPDPVPLVRPFMQVILEDRSRWSYAFRLSGGRAHAEVTHREGSGDFVLWTGRLEPCPLRFSAPRTLAMSACLPIDVGRLEAAGRGVTPSNRVTRLWLSIGGAGRVEWRILEVLVLEITGELLLPIVRDRFFVGSDATAATLHRTPAVAGAATVGLGVRFP
jgi:hypothetical protein